MVRISLGVAMLSVLLAAPAVHAKDEPLRVVRPAAKPVTVETTHESLGVTELGFANGVRCYVRSMPKTTQAVCRLTFLGGMGEETEANRGITEAATVALAAGSQRTATLKPGAITRFLGTGVPVHVVPTLGATEVHLDLIAPAGRLEDALWVARELVLGAQLTKFALGNWRMQVLGQMAWSATDVTQQSIQARAGLVSGGDVRVLMPSAKQVAAIKHGAAQAWLERLLRTAPLTVSMAGPATPAASRELLAAYVGSLPARTDDAARLMKLFRTGPWAASKELRRTVAATTPAAACQVGWPVSTEVRTTHEAALAIGANVLRARCADALQEKLGTKHLPNCWLDTQRHAGSDGLWFFTLTSPRSVEKVPAIIQAEVARLSASEGELPGLDAARNRMEMDPAEFVAGRWVYELSMLPGVGQTAVDLARRIEAFAAVESDDVRAALVAVCRDESMRAIVVSTPRTKRAPHRVLAPGEEGELYVDGSDFPSRVFIPKDYKQGTPLPLILHLHGSGDKPTTAPWRAALEERGAIIVGLSYGAQADGGSGGMVLGDPDSCRSGAAYIEKVRAAVDAQYGIDQERVVLSGFSMGGWGVNYYGFLDSARDRYAAYAIMAAGTTEAPTVDLTVAKGQPVLLLNGSEDAALPSANTGKPLLTKAGAVVTQVVLEGEGHVPSAGAMGEPLRTWLAAAVKWGKPLR